MLVFDVGAADSVERVVFLAYGVLRVPAWIGPPPPIPGKQILPSSALTLVVGWLIVCGKNADLIFIGTVYVLAMKLQLISHEQGKNIVNEVIDQNRAAARSTNLSASNSYQFVVASKMSTGTAVSDTFLLIMIASARCTCRQNRVTPSIRSPRQIHVPNTSKNVPLREIISWKLVRECFKNVENRNVISTVLQSGWTATPNFSCCLCVMFSYLFIKHP